MKAKLILGTIFSTALISSTLTYQITTYISAKKSEPERITQIPNIRTDRGSIAVLEKQPYTQADISEPAHPKNHADSERTVKKNKFSGLKNIKTESIETIDEIRQRLVEQEKKIRELQTFAQSNKNENIIEQAQSNYDKEEIDYDWAFRKEDSLLSLFDTYRELTSFSPLDISCKSENCQLVLAVETEEQARTIYQSFLEAVTKNQKHPEQTVSYFTNASNGQLVMYVSESGKSILFK